MAPVDSWKEDIDGTWGSQEISLLHDPNLLKEGKQWTSTGEHGPHLMIEEVNQLIVEIDEQISIVHNFIRDEYQCKFPELSSVVRHPTDYATVVKRIGNEMDLSIVNLEGLLSPADIMVVSVIASTTGGKPLPDGVLRKTMEACDRLLTLDSAKNDLVNLLESRMRYIAPNLSSIVGSAVAAKLIGAAGGLSGLAKMPACDVKLLGAKEKNLAGFSSDEFRVGYIEQTQIFQSTPPSLRKRACRLLASKAALAVRLDSSSRGGGHDDDPGKSIFGQSLREEISKTIEKWQEPPPAKKPKPLPVPDYGHKKKQRGGRRLRKMKERYALTDKRKRANRMQFGIQEEEERNRYNNLLVSQTY